MTDLGSCECGTTAHHLAVMVDSDSPDAVQAVCCACAAGIAADPEATGEGWRVTVHDTDRLPA